MTDNQDNPGINVPPPLLPGTHFRRGVPGLQDKGASLGRAGLVSEKAT